MTVCLTHLQNMIHSLRSIAVQELAKKYDSQPELVSFMRETIDAIVDAAQMEIDAQTRLVGSLRKSVEELTKS